MRQTNDLPKGRIAHSVDLVCAVDASLAQANDATAVSRWPPPSMVRSAPVVRA